MLDVIQKIIEWIFSRESPVPLWIRVTIGALLGLWGFLAVSSKIKALWLEHFWPLLYKPEEKRRVMRRQRFADHIESEIRRLNNLEAWSDYRFAELEAEVEAEGRRRAFSLIPFFQASQSGLRRERSLSTALERSQERLILLEGDPGSGKSVALRYVARSMARRAIKAQNVKSVIPLYINLKELERQKKEPIDRNLIQSFVLKSLNRANDRDIEEFLENEFERGSEEGTWLFLFDSFDELPEVLSSTEADATIRSYSDAISDFLHGMNQCRGVVASRQFRGPGQTGWPRFRILPLPETRRAELVRKADLKPELENTIIGQLGTTGNEIRVMASNPMFLGLLCDYMRAGNEFPQNAHNVFETYVENRLTRDEERLQRRFKLEPARIRSMAESVAFCMAADPGLGLSPTRENLQAAMNRLGFPMRRSWSMELDALEYIKLARSETATASGDSKPFTFAHRRFQEYFATCVVLSEPDRVSPRLLLTDARWRETAVVMCQTQSIESLSPIITEAHTILEEIVKEVPGLIEKPLEYVETSQEEKEKDKQTLLPAPFPWPSGLLHILGLLQDGFGSRLRELPDDIRTSASRLILSASSTGTLFDKKWGLEVAGVVPQPILLWLLREAFHGSSQWLKDIAYQQVARLSEIPSDIASGIRQALIVLLANGRLNRERHATYAHLNRLTKSTDLLLILQLLFGIAFVDIFLHIIMFVALTVKFVPVEKSCLIRRLEVPLCSFFSSFQMEVGRTRNFLPGTGIISEGALISLSLIIFLVFLFLLISHFSYRTLAIFPSGSRFNEEIIFVLGFIWRFVGACLLLTFIGIYSKTVLDVRLLFIYYGFVSWTPFALLSARTGQFTHPLWWPLMPLWPFLYLTLNARVVFTKLLENWRVPVFIIILGIALFFLASLSPDCYRPHCIPLFWAMFLIFLVFVVLPLELLYLILLVLKSALNWITGRIRWQRWLQRYQTAITTQEFLETIGQHGQRFGSRLVRTVRQQGLLVATKDTEILVERLAIALEHALIIDRQRRRLSLPRRILFPQYSKKESKTSKSKGHSSNMELDNASFSKSTNTSSEPDFFDLWLAKYTKKNKQRLAELGSEFLDETYMLLEQLRANRREQVQEK